MPTSYSIKWQEIVIFSTAHVIITQNTKHRNIMYLYRGHSASTSLEKVEGVDKELNNKKCSQKSEVPHENSSMYFFSNSAFSSWFLMKL